MQFFPTYRITLKFHSASINLVSIFRCSSSPSNPVYSRCVDSSALGFSLSTHRHSYIGLVFSSRVIHNKQQIFFAQFVLKNKKTFSISNEDPSNLVYARHVDSLSLGFSLSSHRQSCIGLVCNSRFIDCGVTSC
jgi:hypothetical protein